MINLNGKKIIGIMTLALLNITLLSFGHAFRIDMVIYVALLTFFLLVLFSPSELFLPIMLFYLPWSTIMKISPGSFSFYTIIAPLYLIVLLLGLKRKQVITLSTTNILIVVMIFVFTLSVKLFSSYSIEPSYLMFMMMLIFIPTYIVNFKNQIVFENCISFLVVGTITASMSSEILMKYSHMVHYINVYELSQVGLVRLSGFYGDPNFYATHILAAIGGLLIIAIWKGKAGLFLCLFGVVVLTFFGMKSVSKMFLIILILIITIWIIAVLLLRGKIGKKISIIISLIIGIIYVLSSTFFTEEINYYMVRFSMIQDTESLTTGRSDTNLNYVLYFLENPNSLFFGVGYTNILPSFDIGSHNSILQTIYQFGLIGTVFILLWLLKLRNVFYIKIKESIGISKKLLLLVFAIVCFLPWLALDILFFDEFFYISILFFVGRDYIVKQKFENYR
jgi:hypothetical protein